MLKVVNYFGERISSEELNTSPIFKLLRQNLSKFVSCQNKLLAIALLSTIENIDNNHLDLCEPVLIKTLLFVCNSFDSNANTNILNATIEYVLSTKRFEQPFFQ